MTAEKPPKKIATIGDFIREASGGIVPNNKQDGIQSLENALAKVDLHIPSEATMGQLLVESPIVVLWAVTRFQPKILLQVFNHIAENFRNNPITLRKLEELIHS